MEAVQCNMNGVHPGLQHDTLDQQQYFRSTITYGFVVCVSLYIYMWVCVFMVHYR